MGMHESGSRGPGGRGPRGGGESACAGCERLQRELEAAQRKVGE